MLYTAYCYKKQIVVRQQRFLRYMKFFLELQFGSLL